MAHTTKKIITTPKAPLPVGPLSQAIIVDRTIYLSGALGVDRTTGNLVAGGAIPETAKALENIAVILQAAGSKIDNVVKCTVLLNDMADFDGVNQEYKKVFTKNYPARTCVQVGKLPRGANVEIEVIAIVGDCIVEHVNVDRSKL
ncbi:2-iminobutanoate/2-iminopropanoate deaminase-like [Chironomus tepperi]|uniref:2-iminobutanoate/2-iminopropanoate deaminase-like n=1 Tax=Chironomus tepperi TaxID=113505 RepID=UPI00391EEB18